jgi:hypothetical protein
MSTKVHNRQKLELTPLPSALYPLPRAQFTGVPSLTKLLNCQYTMADIGLLGGTA